MLTVWSPLSRTPQSGYFIWRRWIWSIDTTIALGGSVGRMTVLEDLVKDERRKDEQIEIGRDASFIRGIFVRNSSKKT